MSSEPEVSIARFRDVLSTFATGVVVITAQDESGPIGMTIQSFASLSLRPALVVFCPARTSATWPRIRRAGSFCANVLAEDQAGLAATMSAPGDRFAGVESSPGLGGSPRLSGALAHIEASLEAVHSGGDHEIAVGLVRRLERARADAGPLVFHGSRFARLQDEGPSLRPRP